MVELTRFITCMESRGFFFSIVLITKKKKKKNLRKAERYLQNITFIRNNSYPSTRFHVVVWYLKINKKIKKEVGIKISKSTISSSENYSLST